MNQVFKSVGKGEIEDIFFKKAYLDFVEKKIPKNGVGSFKVATEVPSGSFEVVLACIRPKKWIWVPASLPRLAHRFPCSAFSNQFTEPNKIPYNQLFCSINGKRGDQR